MKREIKMMKKILSMVLACTLALGSAVVAQAADTSFADVKSSDWYCEFVHDMHERGLIEGRGDGLFHPGDTITRGEYYTILCRMTGVKLENDGTGHWAEAAGDQVWYWSDYVDRNTAMDTVEWLDTAITRQEAIEIAMRAYGYCFPTSVAFLENPFADIKVDKNIFDGDHAYLLNAYHLGIISGDDQGLVRPDATMTRAEACKVLLNVEAADLSKHEKLVKPDSFQGVEVKFIGDSAYSFYNDVAKFLSYLPADLLEGFVAKGGTIIVTDENQSKYIGAGQVEASGCYLSTGNDIVCFTDGNSSSLFFGIASTLCHEFGHYMYENVLTAEDKALLSESFTSDELNNFAKAIGRSYCKTNVNEYFAEIVARSIQPWAAKALVNCDCEKGLSVIQKYLTTAE